ncbi:hypothetical protein JCM3766R1_005716 [Sporobolomyces carnicolor]
MRHFAMSIVTLGFLVVDRAHAQRTIVIENLCDYDVFPAISPFPGNAEGYTGPTGWKAKPASKETISVPSKWSGRLWGRRGCMTDSNGFLACVAGGCKNGLECGESVLAESTALELRLQSSTNGQYDAYDLQNGGGWSVPTRVKPDAKACPTVECVPDLDACPREEMKLKDSYGVTLGCQSACFAGIDDPTVQCCTGDYADPKKCTPDKIIGYDYFKGCKNAYAYFQDRTSNTVDMLCPSEDEPGYTLTFCPDGDGGYSGATGAGNSSTKSGDDTTTRPDGEPTGPAQPKPTDIPALTSPASVDATATDKGGASETDAAATSSTTTAPAVVGGSSDTAAAETRDATVSKAAPSSSSSSLLSGEILGFDKPVFAAVVGGIGVATVLALVGVCLCMRNRGSGDGPAAQRQPTENARTEQTSQQMSSSSANQNPAQSYALGRAGSRRGRARDRDSHRRALLAEHARGSSSSTDSDSSSSFNRPSSSSRRRP